MSKYAMKWADIALRQEEELETAYALLGRVTEENRQLRDLIARLAFEVSKRHDLELFELARSEIEARFPESEEGRLAA